MTWDRAQISRLTECPQLGRKLSVSFWVIEPQKRQSACDPIADIHQLGVGQHSNRAFPVEFIPRTLKPERSWNRASAVSSPVANCGNLTFVCPAWSSSSHQASAPHGPLSHVSTYIAPTSAIRMRCSRSLGARQTISSSAVTVTTNCVSECFIRLGCLDCRSGAMSVPTQLLTFVPIRKSGYLARKWHRRSRRPVAQEACLLPHLLPERLPLRFRPQLV